MPSRPDIVAELTGYGVHPGLADELATSDLLARVHDELIVITEETDAITTQPRVLATLLKPADGGEPELLPALIDLARARFPDIGQMMLVIPAGRHLPEPRLGHPYMRYVLATDDVARTDSEPGWAVRPARRTDLSDVLPLLITALVDGYGASGDTVAEAEVESDATQLFGRALAEGIVFVAHDSAGFAGHVTILPDQDELSGRDRLELFDLFVLPHRRATPASGLLTSAALRYAKERGLPLRGYVSGHGSTPTRVLDSLIAKGWRQDTAYWMLPLRQEEGLRVD